MKFRAFEDGRKLIRKFIVNRIGMWSASMLFLLGTIYACTVIVGMNYFGFSNPIVGTILIVMEMLTLIYAPLMVILMCSIYTVASENSKPFILIALAFMIIVVVTIIVFRLFTPRI